MADLEVDHEPNDDLRGDLARAFATASEAPEAPAVEAPEAPETPEKPEQTAEERARDEAGRFAKAKRETLKLKPAEGTETPAAPEKPTTEAPAAKVDIPPPTEWLGEQKLPWKNVPNALKQ